MKKCILSDRIAIMKIIRNISNILTAYYSNNILNLYSCPGLYCKHLSFPTVQVHKELFLPLVVDCLKKVSFDSSDHTHKIYHLFNTFLNVSRYSSLFCLTSQHTDEGVLCYICVPGLGRSKIVRKIFLSLCKVLPQKLNLSTRFINFGSLKREQLQELHLFS